MHAITLCATANTLPLVEEEHPSRVLCFLSLSLWVSLPPASTNVMLPNRVVIMQHLELSHARVWEAHPKNYGRCLPGVLCSGTNGIARFLGRRKCNSILSEVALWTGSDPLVDCCGEACTELAKLFCHPFSMRKHPILHPPFSGPSTFQSRSTAERRRWASLATPHRGSSPQGPPGTPAARPRLSPLQTAAEAQAPEPFAFLPLCPEHAAWVAGLSLSKMRK